MMGVSGEPNGYYPMDSNGVWVQSAMAAPCVCPVVDPQALMVCPPLGDGSCEGGRCEGMPPLLPPRSPVPGWPPPGFPGEESIIWRTNDPFDQILRILSSPFCASVGRKEGLKAIAECRKRKKGHPNEKHCDKFGHCVAMCVATQCSGRWLAWCMGWLRDPPFIGDPEDRAANWAGEQCGESGVNCGQCCGAWWEHKYGPNPCPHCHK